MHVDRAASVQIGGTSRARAPGGDEQQKVDCVYDTVGVHVGAGVRTCAPHSGQWSDVSR